MKMKCPAGILCERAENPVWIDCANPRFSWRAVVERRGHLQTAYRLLVARDERRLRAAMANRRGALWDSGLVRSRECIDVEYKGPRLISFGRYAWTVMIVDETGKPSEYAEPAFFEMALLDQNEWMGEWIGAPEFSAAAAYFRRDFYVPCLPESCRLFIATPAWAEVSINGQKPDDRTMDPARTDWNKRLLYSTFEIGGLLNKGANTVGVTLGNGWYRSMLFNTPHPSLPFSLFVMERRRDGSPHMLLRTEQKDWRATCQGPVREQDIYNGEAYDARLEMGGWDRPGFANRRAFASWQEAIPLEKPAGFLKAQAMEPETAIREIAPEKSWKMGANSRMFDFGENFSGRLSLEFRGKRDTEIVMRHAELVDKKGRLQVNNLRSARNTDRYISRGAAAERYEPRFTYHGFRYAAITADPAVMAGMKVRGVHIRSAVRPIGTFACSDPLLNRIHTMCVRTESNNLHGLPTDCPQRDERLGWLNDMTVRVEEAIHNFDLAQLYAKWLDDISDAQGAATGAIADTAPAFRYGRTPADPVCASYLLVPWLAYLHYGDRRILAAHYAGFKAWAGYLDRIAEDGILKFSSYGDWAPPLRENLQGSIGASALSAKTPGALISSGFYFYTLNLLARIATALGRKTEACKYARKVAAARIAFNRKFFDPAQNSYATGSQACNILPLYMGLVPENHKAAVFDNLARDLDSNGGRLTTGNICTKYLPEVLAQGGRLDMALSLLRRESYPSWGYMLSKGATTVWERWEHIVSGPLCAMASHDHPMYGSIDAFFYMYLAGIRPVDSGPGYGRLRIRPHFHQSLKRATAAIETPRGRLAVRWQLGKRRLDLGLEIPWNADAIVDIQNGHTGRWREIRESGRAVWRDGRFVSDSGTLDRGATGGRFISFRIGAGHYAFSCST